jgi:hypothetical protein
VYGKVIVLELDLDGWGREGPAMVSLDVRELDSQCVPPYLVARPDLEGAEIFRRLGQGHRCFVTWSRDRITSAVWFGTGPMWVPEIASVIHLEPGQVYGYDSWTDPDERGRNIAATRGITTCTTLRDAGFRSIVAYVLAGNRAGLRPLAKLGFQRVATVGSIRLGVVRFDFTRMQGGRTKWRPGRHRHRWSELANGRE